MLACALVLAGVVLAAQAGKYPHFAGFWAGVDQQRYLESARAWSALDLAPARHHYLPLYPLMAAPFVRLTPWQPFMVPDLLCQLAALLLFVRIGRRLAPDWPEAVAAVCFLIAVMGSKTLLGLWIVPWSSTGAAPFQFASVLLALRFAERPGAGRAASLGLAIAATAGVRPGDAAVLLASCGGFAGFAVLRAGTRPRTCLLAGFAGAGGLASGLLGIAILHGLIFGWAAGPYIAESAAIGFEWRLLPMRWVMLVVDPRPLLPEGSGMMQHLPWLIPGIAGLLLVVAPGRGKGIAANTLAGATVLLHWAAYLAYRDMHAYGLWRFYNIHYFKWTFPFLVLWAARFAAAVFAKAERKRALATLAVTLLLFAWRPVLRKPCDVPLQEQDHRIILPRAPQIGEALMLPLSAPGWAPLYFAQTRLSVAGGDYVTKRDTKLLPVPGGALLITLRPLPAGSAVLELPADIALDARRPARLLREAAVFGLPCAILTRRPACIFGKP